MKMISNEKLLTKANIRAFISSLVAHFPLIPTKKIGSRSNKGKQTLCCKTQPIVHHCTPRTNTQSGGKGGHRTLLHFTPDRLSI